MLLAFHSNVAADVLMLSEHALPVLQAAGRACPDGVPERGAFSVEQLPDAIAGIERAIAQEEPVSTDEDDEDAELQPPMAQVVSFRQRAYPLLEMMRLSSKQGASVMWEQASNW